MGSSYPNFRKKMLPDDLRNSFTVEDIEATWNYLEFNFKLNKRKWKNRFQKELKSLPSVITPMEFFIQFGSANFQSSLNTFLFRHQDHPTFISLMRFIVKEKIEKYSQQNEHNRFNDSKNIA
jgi:hypothetical protein